MTASFHDAVYSDEHFIESAIRNIIQRNFSEFVHEAPATLIIGLHSLDPMKHPNNPLQLVAVFTAANCFRVSAEIGIRIKRRTSIHCRALADGVIEPSEEAATVVNMTKDPSSPPATSYSCFITQ